IKRFFAAAEQKAGFPLASCPPGGYNRGAAHTGVCRLFRRKIMKRETFGSRLGFILVSAGCAIGIGNVWRFPFLVGQHGGGVFVLFYLMFLVIKIGRASCRERVGLWVVG